MPLRGTKPPAGHTDLNKPNPGKVSAQESSNKGVSQYQRYIPKKLRTEEILLKAIAAYPDICIDTEKQKSTPVYIGENRALNIFYRKRTNAVRINVPCGGSLHSLAQELVLKGLAYQKSSADSGANSGQYAFFVDEPNEPEVYKILLLNGYGEV